VKEQEMGERITHLAFGAGWLRAMSAAPVAAQISEENTA
jgi:alkylhydroperoxidase/carboxymuconolactone decarboxylase family protein YurZ